MGNNCRGLRIEKGLQELRRVGGGGAKEAEVVAVEVRGKKG